MFIILRTTSTSQPFVTAAFQAETQDEVLNYIYQKWDEDKSFFPELQTHISKKYINKPEYIVFMLNAFNSPSISYHILPCSQPLDTQNVILDYASP